MTQILTQKAEKIENAEKIEKFKVEEKITDLIIRLQISPIHYNRVFDLFNRARKTVKLYYKNVDFILAICFYRLNLEEKLYISLKKIKNLLGIRNRRFLSNNLRLYDKFCKDLHLKPICFALIDHISNICDLVGLGEEIKKKAFNLANMIRKNFIIPGEYRTVAITSIYFASNFDGELLSIDQLDYYFELMSQSMLYEKIRIFEKYMKEYFRRKAQKTKLSKREKYFLNNYSTETRDGFFRKFKSVKNFTNV